jgi:hypothetical protein
MQTFFVTWEIHVDAETPEAAAREAWGLMRRPGSTANVFDVFDTCGNMQRVDLAELDQEPQA